MERYVVHARERALRSRGAGPARGSCPKLTGNFPCYAPAFTAGNAPSQIEVRCGCDNVRRNRRQTEMLKSLKDRAVKSAKVAADGAKTVMASEACGRCGTVYSVGALQLASCCICMRRICAKCRDKVSVLEHLMDARSDGMKKKQVSDPSASVHVVCKAPCLAEAVEANVTAFRETLTNLHLANLEVCLAAVGSVECYAREYMSSISWHSFRTRALAHS